jgi:hypothetical protein
MRMRTPRASPASTVRGAGPSGSSAPLSAPLTRESIYDLTGIERPAAQMLIGAVRADTVARTLRPRVEDERGNEYVPSRLDIVHAIDLGPCFRVTLRPARQTLLVEISRPTRSRARRRSATRVR